MSLSGGRTSGFMLRRVIDEPENAGKLHMLRVLFANTGKEDEATLRFVHRIETEWRVPVVWVEFRDDEAGYAVVDFETASRRGEPYEALIRKRKYLPNLVTRFCTSELKIRAMHRYLRSLGWADGDDGWDQLIGIRADEQRRIARIRARGHSSESAKESMRLPLADAGVTAAHVGAFWSRWSFDLELPNIGGRTMHGNCDLCFLKPAAQVLSLIREDPTRAVWWARMETLVPRNAEGDGHRFRKDRTSYAEMARFAGEQADMFDAEEALIECLCNTD